MSMAAHKTIAEAWAETEARLPAGLDVETVAFWCEFFGEYLRPPAGPLVQKDPHVFGGDSTPRISYVVGVQAYTAHVGNWDTGGSRAGLGFGGAAFTVRLDDGREFFTNNNWSRGTVPVRLRKLMPSNAVFVRQPEAGTAEE